MDKRELINWKYWNWRLDYPTHFFDSQCGQ